MAMAEQRVKRHSPPSAMSTLSKLSTFASPTGPSNGSRKLETFSQVSGGLSSLPGYSPTLERRNNYRSSEPSEVRSKVTIRLRRLPRNFGNDALRSMLLFAKDLDETKFVDSDTLGFDEHGYSCAVATFHSEAGALEAQDRLNGKPNATNDANMIVEVLSGPYPGSTGSRRNTVDGTASRQQNGSGTSSTSPNNPLSRTSSRFSSSFQNMEKISPPLGSPTATIKEFPAPDGSNRLQNIFSPQSPVANSYSDYHRISGKAVINDDIADDETRELLYDPVAYANATAEIENNQPPRFTNPLPQFSGLSLNTSVVNGNTRHMGSSPDSAFTSPRTIQSPNIQSPAGASMTPNGNPHMSFPRHFPPVNPADQNPPCNTLYVGNLPLDTNEDELKQIFCKEYGFKRLCMRSKGNGPMCFVEFDDIGTATRALNKLYGKELSNSYKGGIRLSFSKNPLGVRNGQNGSHIPMSPQAMAAAFNNGLGAPPGFSTANGPPPGLTPPGLRSPPTYNASSMSDGFGRGYAPRYGGMSPQVRPQQSAGGYPFAPANGAFGSMNNAFSDYSNGAHSSGGYPNGAYPSGAYPNGAHLNGAYSNGSYATGR